jgi:hypothetical protein
MEEIDHEEAPKRLKLTELALSVFSQVLAREHELHGVASVYNEGGGCVVHGPNTDMDAFYRRVYLTATAIKAEYLTVLWPYCNPDGATLALPAMYHHRGRLPSWTYIGVNQVDCIIKASFQDLAGLKVPPKVVNLWWKDRGWWEGGSPPKRLVKFQLAPEIPSEIEAQRAAAMLLVEGGHEKLTGLFPGDEPSS